MLNKILNLVAPVSCQVCDAKGVLVCPGHFPQAEPIPEVAAGLQGYYARELGDELLSVMTAFKDRSMTALAKDLAELAEPLLDTPPWRAADLVVHPPSSRSAYRKRGFVPTKLILQRLRQSLEIRSLSLTRQPQDQRLLNASQRTDNLLGSYSCGPLTGRSVVLFDDVMTTSATIQEMSRAVTQAGGRVTGFCVVARRLLVFDPSLEKQA